MQKIDMLVPLHLYGCKVNEMYTIQTRTDVLFVFSL